MAGLISRQKLLDVLHRKRSRESPACWTADLPRLLQRIKRLSTHMAPRLGTGVRKVACSREATKGEPAQNCMRPANHEGRAHVRKSATCTHTP